MKYLKYFSIIVLMILSFYFTDKIMVYIENKSPLMLEISAKASGYEETFVNAIIDGNTIVPGLNGKNINKHKSYIKMGEFGSFNETFLVYDDIKPEVSLKDNLDKIIIKGNTIKREISLVLEPNTKAESFLEEKNIPYTLIANLKTNILKNHEYINGEKDEDKMSDLHTILNRKKQNPLICIMNYSNLEYCQMKKYYIISPTLDTDINITKLLSQIKSGVIILVKNNFSLANLNLLLNEIKRQDLKITYLSKLISESN